MSEENKNQIEVSSEEQEQEGLNFLDIFYLCLSKWRWILASVLICLCIAFFYIKRTPPVYMRSASVLIKDESPKGGGAVNELTELGGIGLQSTVYNEVLTLKSPSVMSGVVKQLGLDVDYYVDGLFYDKTLYGSNLPYKIQFNDMDKAFLSGELSVSNNKFSLALNSLNGEESDQVITGALLDTIKGIEGFGKGTIVVSHNEAYVPNPDPEAQPIESIKIVKYRTNNAVSGYLASMSADLADKNADVIDITYTDVSIERATDVVNTIIQVYNDNWLQEKNQITVSTSKFLSLIHI